TISTRNWPDGLAAFAATRTTAISMFAAAAPVKGDGLGELVPDQEAAAEGQRRKARLRDRRSANFSGSASRTTGASGASRQKPSANSRRRSGTLTPPDTGDQPAAVDREPHAIPLGWRGYFGFCQTPRVLTNLKAWI